MMSQNKFVNREKELQFLNKLYKNNKSDLFILYGRRRIGKTQLTLEFLKNKKGTYYMCSEEGDLINIKSFQKELSKNIDNEFNTLKIDNWYDLFSIFFKLYTKKEKLIIIIDEFPYLIKKNPAIPSIFQKLWDELLINKNIFLILTGSSVSIMEKKVLNVKSPLYGRRTAQWDLGPIPFKHISSFLPNHNLIDLYKIYFVFGGIPAYLQKLNKGISKINGIPISEKSKINGIPISNKSKINGISIFGDSFETSVIEQIFTKGNFLNQEGNLLLNYEFSETTNYKLILSAISQGNLKQKEIVDFTHLDYSLVSKYLSVLKNISIITEEIPVTESKRFKGRLYKIKDNYLQFWFRYLFSDLSYVESHEPEEIYNFYKTDMDAYFGYKFEDLIKELFTNYELPTKNKYNLFGRVWGKMPLKYIVANNKSTYEIDIVGIDSITKKNILFCEVKWKDNVDASIIAKDLILKSKYIKWGIDNRSEEFIIIAKSYSNKISQVDDVKFTCFDLKDINTFLK